MPVPPTIATLRMFCRQCGYILDGLPSNRCPECGRDFDPGDPRSFLARPRRTALRRLVKIAVVLFCLTLPLDSYVGYLGWQLHAERKAIQVLRHNRVEVKTFDTTPHWAKVILRGHGDWLWERAREVYVFDDARDAQIMAAVGNLKYLKEFRIFDHDAHLTDLDMAQLKGLKSLSWLTLWGDKVTDASLASLKDVKSLRVLQLIDTNVTETGVSKLRKALPHCMIDCWRYGRLLDMEHWPANPTRAK